MVGFRITAFAEAATEKMIRATNHDDTVFALVSVGAWRNEGRENGPVSGN